MVRCGYCFKEIQKGMFYTHLYKKGYNPDDHSECLSMSERILWYIQDHPSFCDKCIDIVEQEWDVVPCGCGG